MKPKVLVTGACGNVGYEVLKQLVQQKSQFDISVFDLKNLKNERLLNKFKNDVHIHYGDITQYEDVSKAVKNQDVVIHLAALIPPLAYDQKSLARKINVEGTTMLVQCLEKYAPHAFLLYSSSVAVYGDRLKNIHIRVTDPIQPATNDNYADTKIEAEKIITNSKLKWSIFRLSAIMGAGNHQISYIIFLMPLDTPMEITTPEDTARAFVNAIQNQIKNKIFNLGGGVQNRILYKDLLKKNFDLYGLGNLDFPEQAFALNNYHCGYYADGDNLENILHFRKDNLESYFKKVKESISPLQYFFTNLFKGIIKKYLLKKSIPFKLHKAG